MAEHNANALLLMQYAALYIYANQPHPLIPPDVDLTDPAALRQALTDAVSEMTIRDPQGVFTMSTTPDKRPDGSWGFKVVVAAREESQEEPHEVLVGSLDLNTPFPWTVEDFSSTWKI
jgi:hypothetical protein